MRGPLLNKDTNVSTKNRNDKPQEVRKRKLALKNSLQTDLENYWNIVEETKPKPLVIKQEHWNGKNTLRTGFHQEIDSNNHSLELIANNNVSPQISPTTQRELTKTLQDNFVNRTPLGEKIVRRINKDTPSDKLLTKQNLKLLQSSIQSIESTNFGCDHTICKNANISGSIDLRIWFLFELEMTMDGSINLRNMCYQEYIYNRIDATWPRANILLEKLPNGFEPFPMEQLLIPEIQLDEVKVTNNIHDNSNKFVGIDEMSVDINSILEENPLAMFPRATYKKIPPSSLSRRNRKEIFDEFQVNTNDIINDISTSSLSDLSISPNKGQVLDSDINLEGNDKNSEDFKSERNLLKKRTKLCSLEKKVNTLEGMVIPKLRK